jgi:hypothetical protein
MAKKIKLEILETGDNVIGFSENRIAVKKKSSDVEIFTLLFDGDGIPRISDVVAVICRKKNSGTKASIEIEDKSIEVGSF